MCRETEVHELTDLVDVTQAISRLSDEELQYLSRSLVTTGDRLRVERTTTKLTSQSWFERLMYWMAAQAEFEGQRRRHLHFGAFSDDDLPLVRKWVATTRSFSPQIDKLCQQLLLAAMEVEDDGREKVDDATAL